MKILITGGAGFMGSNFARHLLNKYPDYKVSVVDALTYAGSTENLPTTQSDGRFEFWYGNVRNGELINTLVSEADAVFHFAAETHVTRSIYDNLGFFETDVMGTQCVANAVTKHVKTIERFIHISTSEVYGTAHAPLMDEEHPLLPMSPYASAKAGADRLVYSYWATYKIPALIIRPFNNYGPYQHLEKAVPRFVTSCLLNEPLHVHGDGSSQRDWLFVGDLCDALDRALHAEVGRILGQVINVGTGRSTSIMELAQLIVDKTGVPRSLIQTIGDRPGQVFRHTAAVDKAKRVLDWEPRTRLEDGLDRTIQWYRDHTEWWKKQVAMRAIPIITAEGKLELH